MQKTSRCARTVDNARCDALPPACCCADRLTSDHAITNEGNKSAEDENLTACIIQDGATDWLQAYPCKTKGAEDTLRCFQRFLGPNIKAKHVYTDNSKEFAKALDDMCVAHDTCQPYTPATNGKAERAVRRVKEGTNSLLVQCGLSDRWWHRAMAAFCMLRNVHDILPDGRTAYEKRFGEPFRGTIIPFGAAITYRPANPDIIAQMAKMGQKTREALFM